MAKRNLITGATGLLGSHLAEQLVQRGDRVRALVRANSDTTFLRQLGVELALGDLGDPESVRRAVDGADVVYHCASKVGEWGPWSEYQTSILDATTTVAEACRHSVGRLLHVSSITVYGHPTIRPGEWLTEEAPLGQNLWRRDYYVRAKIAAEEAVRRSGVPATVIRPSWIFGPRDRNTMPRMILAIRSGRFGVIGDGRNLLNVVYVGDVADGAIRAAELPVAVGQAYNLSSPGELTQRQFVDAITDGLGLPRVTRSYPYRAAFALGWFSEVVGRLIRIRRPPHVTRYGVSLMGRSTQFSLEKANRDLDWRPRTSTAEGLRRTLEWFRTMESPAQ